jgi:hypothetical protein
MGVKSNEGPPKFLIVGEQFGGLKERERHGRESRSTRFLVNRTRECARGHSLWQCDSVFPFHAVDAT